MSKVLIVDDDRSMVSLLKTLLQLDGFDVAFEARAVDVLNAVRREKPDVVLMDVHLADADGLEILANIRADSELAKTRVILASGEDVSYQGQKAGANDFILKPYTPDQLAAVLKKVLAQP